MAVLFALFRTNLLLFPFPVIPYPDVTKHIFDTTYDLVETVSNGKILHTAMGGFVQVITI
jgi:hypothetical protein